MKNVIFRLSHRPTTMMIKEKMACNYYRVCYGISPVCTHTHKFYTMFLMLLLLFIFVVERIIETTAGGSELSLSVKGNKLLKYNLSFSYQSERSIRRLMTWGLEPMEGHHMNLGVTKCSSAMSFVLMWKDGWAIVAALAKVKGHITYPTCSSTQQLRVIHYS